jgi:hypothetical protein
MEQDSSTDNYLSPEASIDELGLSIRPLNALKRANIHTIRELFRLRDTGRLQDVRNIGQKSLIEIENSLARMPRVVAPESSAKLDSCPSDTVSAQTNALMDQANQPVDDFNTFLTSVVTWQVGLIEKQISAGLLHRKAKIAGRSIMYWLSAVDSIDHHQLFETMASVLGTSINICEELLFLFDQIPHNYLGVLLSRYGLQAKKLEDIGGEIGVTRERVRQIGVKLEKRIGARVISKVRAESASDLAWTPSLVRMQSALLAAKDMGLDITYKQWERDIRLSGLVGSWPSSDYITIDPVESMIAVCNLLADHKIRELSIPDNLNYAIQLVVSGMPNLQARILHIRQRLPKATRKQIRRHALFSGGANAKWLSHELQEEVAHVRDALQALGYKAFSEDWFVPSVEGQDYKIHQKDCFHHSLRKMFQYCGPLPIDEICSGIRYATSRTDYPVPPPNVMDQILQVYGYKKEGELYYWEGETGEELSRGEAIIMDCLHDNGPVVHHAELAQAFVDSELTFPSLHATLNRSPLFKRIETGLYKLRGTSVTRADIERAEAAGERVPVDPEIEYAKTGNIIVCATLSIIAVGTGVIFCERFPNLSGEWICLVHRKGCGKLNATENEFRGLQKPFELLDCKTEDRLQFTFNTWDRTVAIEKIGD